MENEIIKICSDLINGEFLITKHFYDQVGTIKIKCINGSVVEQLEINKIYNNQNTIIFGFFVIIIGLFLIIKQIKK